MAISGSRYGMGPLSPLRALYVGNNPISGQYMIGPWFRWLPPSDWGLNDQKYIIG